MTDEMIPVHEKDAMPFDCSSKNSCFNECCRDLNQALTPYDILRLKRNLGISSQVFLKKYTSLHYGPESGLPIVTFKPNPGTGHENNAKPYPDSQVSLKKAGHFPVPIGP